MRFLRRMQGHQTVPRPPEVVAPPPLPPAVPEADRRLLREAQLRIPRKWKTLDGLLDQFADTDVVLRVDRR